MNRPYNFLLAIVSVFLCIASSVYAQTPEKLPVEAYTREPVLETPLVSPSGAQVAWVEEGVLYIYDRQSQEIYDLHAREEQEFHLTSWASDQYLILDIAQRADEKKYKSHKFSAGYVLVDNKAHFVRNLLEDNDGVIKERYILSVHSDDDPYIIYLNHTYAYSQVDAKATLSVFRQDIKANKNYKIRQKDKIYSTAIGNNGFEKDYEYNFGPFAKYEYDSLTFDSDGVARLFIYPLAKNEDNDVVRINYLYKPTADSEWLDHVLEAEAGHVYGSAYYFEKENSIYYEVYNTQTNFTEIYKFDYKSGSTTLWNTFEGNEVEPIGDPHKGNLIGFAVSKKQFEPKWLDFGFERIYADLQKAFPKKSVNLVSYNQARTVFAIKVSAPDFAPTYYLYDTNTHEANIIGEDYSALIDQPLAPMTIISYKARDGLDIPAFVTTPVNVTKPAPLIVYAHDGPVKHDVYDFDPRVQFFANRGYVVLQPQYRGSSGYGDAFQKAGEKHLREMNFDIEDGVKHLVDQGLVDPNKVCIVGWSWGGYLAQSALAFTPETYACAVSVFGISDLDSKINNRYNSKHWQKIIGDYNFEGKLIRGASPIYFVDQIKAPLLLLDTAASSPYGDTDSVRMYEVMSKAGKSVKLVKIEPDLVSEYGSYDIVTLIKEMDAFIADAVAKVDQKAQPQPAH